jgi:GTPase SAR1 family protein
MNPSATSSPASGSQSRQKIARDTILVVGGPGSGKTVWIARLLEALRERVVTVGGRIPQEGVRSSAEASTGIECTLRGQRTMESVSRTIALLHQREWPARTPEPVEHEVDFELTDGRGALRSRRSVTMTEIPGITLLSAYSPSNPSPWAFQNVVERAAGVVLVVDPQQAVEDSVQARETMAATVAFLSHLRSSRGGRGVPLTLVLAKCDRGRRAISAAGGVRRFVLTHLGDAVKTAGQVRVFVSAAARSRLVEGARRDPSVWRPPDNVVEPVLFLLETLDTLDLVRRRRAERTLALEAASSEDLQRVPRAHARKQRVVRAAAWSGFAVATLLLALALVRFAFEISARQSSVAGDGTSRAPGLKGPELKGPELKGPELKSSELKSSGSTSTESTSTESKREVQP